VKKYLLYALLLLNLTYISAQTIVSTEIEHKKIILEEYTGIHCGYCPEGHEIANSIMEHNPGNAFVINIHTGSFAEPEPGEPDFRTYFGPLFRAQADITGLPAATVNRHNFTGISQSGGTGMSRDHWEDAADTILEELSFVNMAMKAEIDFTNRELNILTEVYYTGDSPKAINYLNIALIQDNTFAYQNGGGINYNHTDRLVWMITGAWGEEINTTSEGSFISRNYTYKIPEKYNGIDAVLSDLKLVGFVAETKQEIQSGNACRPTFSNFPYNDVVMEQLDVPNNVCSNSISPIVEVQNKTANSLTELEFEYSINGGPIQTYIWNGSIGTLQTKTIALDEISFPYADEYALDVRLIFDDNDQTNNRGSAIFNPAPEGNRHLLLYFLTDNAGDQCTWDIRDSEGNILQSGGPYENNQYIQENFMIEPGCNTFNLYDSYGNGGGYVRLSDSEGNPLYYTIGDYGSGQSQLFNTVDITSVYNTGETAFMLFPNPAGETIHISFPAFRNPQKVTIFDVFGKQVKEISTGNTQKQIDIDVSEFAKGYYFFKFSNGMVEKVMVN
jgi:hypothetical protein